MSDILESALHELARDLRIAAPPEDLAARVAQQVQHEPAPRPSRAARVRWWVAGRTRSLVALLAALVVTGVVVSPVGATVTQWFGFHGVVVTERPPALDGEPGVPAEPAGLTLGQAAELAGFTPRVPSRLGAPDGVAVSPDRRVVSLTWGTGADTVRLDQFDGTTDPLFWKASPEAQRVTVLAGDALWFPGPHEVTVVPERGDAFTAPPRLAAQTLVWPRGAVTLRLEGDLSQATAVEIAESAG